MQNPPNSSQYSLQNAPQPSNVRRLILPSISAAAVVFGLSLTILGTHRTEWFERRAAQSQGTPIDISTDRNYVLTNQGRDNAIRVVGVAIVLSVATGIVTVELLRKRYAAREKSAGNLPLLRLSLLGSSYQVQPRSNSRSNLQLLPTIQTRILTSRTGLPFNLLFSFCPEPMKPIVKFYPEPFIVSWS